MVRVVFQSRAERVLAGAIVVVCVASGAVLADSSDGIRGHLPGWVPFHGRTAEPLGCMAMGEEYPNRPTVHSRVRLKDYHRWATEYTDLDPAEKYRFTNGGQDVSGWFKWLDATHPEWQTPVSPTDPECRGPLDPITVEHYYTATQDCVQWTTAPAGPVRFRDETLRQWSADFVAATAPKHPPHAKDFARWLDKTRPGWRQIAQAEADSAPTNCPGH